MVCGTMVRGSESQFQHGAWTETRKSETLSRVYTLDGILGGRVGGA